MVWAVLCACVDVCVQSKPFILRVLWKVLAAVLLSSPSSGVQQTASRFTENLLVFEGLNIKAAGGGFWFSTQNFNRLLSASIPLCCILAHIWMERSDLSWSRSDGGVSFYPCSLPRTLHQSYRFIRWILYRIQRRHLIPIKYTCIVNIVPDLVYSVWCVLLI